MARDHSPRQPIRRRGGQNHCGRSTQAAQSRTRHLSAGPDRVLSSRAWACCPYPWKVTDSRGHSYFCVRRIAQPYFGESTSYPRRCSNRIDADTSTRSDSIQRRRWRQGTCPKSLAGTHTQHDRSNLRHPFLHSTRAVTPRSMVPPSFQTSDGARRNDSMSLE